MIKDAPAETTQPEQEDHSAVNAWWSSDAWEEGVESPEPQIPHSPEQQPEKTSPAMVEAMDGDHLASVAVEPASGDAWEWDDAPMDDAPNNDQHGTWDDGWSVEVPNDQHGIHQEWWDDGSSVEVPNDQHGTLQESRDDGWSVEVPNDQHGIHQEWLDDGSSVEVPNDRHGTLQESWFDGWSDEVPNDQHGTLQESWDDGWSVEVPNDQHGTLQESWDDCWSVEVPNDQHGTPQESWDDGWSVEVPNDQHGTLQESWGDGWSVEVPTDQHGTLQESWDDGWSEGVPNDQHGTLQESWDDGWSVEVPNDQHGTWDGSLVEVPQGYQPGFQEVEVPKDDQNEIQQKSDLVEVPHSNLDEKSSWDESWFAEEPNDWGHGDFSWDWCDGDGTSIPKYMADTERDANDFAMELEYALDDFGEPCPGKD